MLILGRKAGDAIYIGDGIRLVVLACDRAGVRLGIEAPADVKIMRGEIVSDITAENHRAGSVGAAVQEWVRLIGGPTPAET
jgi:carbon storage regulator